MEVLRAPLDEPPLRDRPEYTVPLVGWPSVALAAGMASLFLLLLRSLGA